MTKEITTIVTESTGELLSSRDKTQIENVELANKLLGELLDLAQGEQISYSDIQAIIVHDPQFGRGRAIMDSARDMAIDKNIVTGSITNWGLKRLTDSQITNSVVVSTVERVRRAAKRGIRKYHAVEDYSGLTRDEQLRHQASVCHLGALAQAADASNITKIETKIQESGKTISIESTFNLFTTQTT